MGAVCPASRTGESAQAQGMRRDETWIDEATLHRADRVFHEWRSWRSSRDFAALRHDYS